MSVPGDLLAAHIRLEDLPEPVTEYKFSPSRRWRFDFAWPDRMIACEVDGGTWSGGRHVRGDGYERDCQKLNTATAEGWRVFRFTTGMVQSGEAIATLVRVITMPVMPRSAEIPF